VGPGSGPVLWSGERAKAAKAGADRVVGRLVENWIWIVRPGCLVMFVAKTRNSARGDLGATGVS
jgi:hypothetical protein